jgi:LPXTG-motif cell wall-anchored protein
MNVTIDEEPLPGDYYGVIYKGSLLIPLAGLVLTGIAVWYLLKKRK